MQKIASAFFGAAAVLWFAIGIRSLIAGNQMPFEMIFAAGLTALAILESRK